MKLALIKFLVGGLAVTLSYIISVILPLKELGGVFCYITCSILSFIVYNRNATWRCYCC